MKVYTYMFDNSGTPKTIEEYAKKTVIFMDTLGIRTSSITSTRHSLLARYPNLILYQSASFLFKLNRKQTEKLKDFVLKQTT